MVLEYKRKFCCCISNLQASKIIALIFASLHSIMYFFCMYLFITSFGSRTYASVTLTLGLIGMIIISIFNFADILLYIGCKRNKKWMLFTWLVLATIRTLIFLFTIQIHGFMAIITFLSLWSWITVYGAIKEIPLNKIHEKYKLEEILTEWFDEFFWTRSKWIFAYVYRTNTVNQSVSRNGSKQSLLLYD